ncbi:MAG: UDP-N-acetylmuramoyl-tripeptide--D-alanyl-D-alanine ligase [Granulosicoccus sp.]|nr:UDP-N-acetylmuramoyl-tripeptide--D-alanyl-D-alanine ligase [Granulosicoccus sp.]
MSLDECVSALQAELVVANEDTSTPAGDNQAAAGATVITGVSIDTRTLESGDLYVAIQGERFNGHDFIGAAIDAGAAAVLTHEHPECSVPQLRVEDTRTALGQLARSWATHFGIPTIAITGSNGKTTVKEIIATILRQIGPVLATRGNLNNEIGVPLTLLDMRKEHDYAVIEMGANHAGEIARLVDIVRPDVALITNIGRAHLEGFGSVEGIARAKSEIFGGLTEDGYAVINADDDYADVMRQAAAHCHTREFGLSPSADVQGVPGSGLNFRTMGQSFSPHFQLSGDHNGMNALAAVAAVQCLDIQAPTFMAGLEQVRSVPGRLEKKPGRDGAKLIDDTYNANPDSARQAVDVLARYDGTRYLVLGDMAELGPDAPVLHARLGAYARQRGLDGLWTTGPLSSHAQKAFAGNTPLAGRHFTDQEALIADIRTRLGAGVTVLVKGSRSARMERVVKALMPVARTSSAGAGKPVT